MGYPYPIALTQSVWCRNTCGTGLALRRQRLTLPCCRSGIRSSNQPSLEGFKTKPRLFKEKNARCSAVRLCRRTWLDCSMKARVEVDHAVACVHGFYLKPHQLQGYRSSVFLKLLLRVSKSVFFCARKKHDYQHVQATVYLLRYLRKPLLFVTPVTWFWNWPPSLKPSRAPSHPLGGYLQDHTCFGPLRQQ